MSFWKRVGGWFSHFGTALSIFQAIPAALVAVVTAYASTGVAWIASFGMFGWVVSGIFGFLSYSLASLMFARSRLLRVEAKMRERISGDGSSFDPMETIYRNKRLYLRDLALLGRKRVSGKKFINCEIIGPGTAIIGLDTDPAKSRSVMKDTNTHDVDCIQIDPSRVSNLAIGFWDCDFEGCNFYHMTLLFVYRSNETLHWITPDFAQPLLLPDAAHEQS
jgi:hypothetical protein